MLTDDEVRALIAAHGNNAAPTEDNGHITGDYPLARAVIAAYEAKLAQQEPVGFIHPQAVLRLENGETVAFRKSPYIGERQIPVFLHPAPQQADRQRVPEGESLSAKALRLADQIDPFTRKATPDHLTSTVAAQTLRLLAAAPEAPAQTEVKDERFAPGGVFVPNDIAWGIVGSTGHARKKAVDALHALLKAAPEAPAQGETVALQEVWEWAGGNPGIKPTRDEVRQALQMLDKVCDEAPPQTESNCIQCRNADSWGLPDQPVCKTCTAGSAWAPLNVDSVNPNKPALRPAKS